MGASLHKRQEKTGSHSSLVIANLPAEMMLDMFLGISTSPEMGSPIRIACIPEVC
jgi:hypothetical protein